LWNPTALFIEGWRSNAIYSSVNKIFTSGKDITTFVLYFVDRAFIWLFI